MRASVLFLLPLAALLSTALAVVTYRGHEVYRLTPTEDQLGGLRQLRQHPGLDFWSRAHLAGHPVVVRVPPHLQRDFRHYLDRSRVLHQLLIPDLEDVVQKERESLLAKPVPQSGQSRISFTEYHRYDEIRQYLSDLAASYPSTVTVQTIGQTYEGRPLDIIQVSSGGGGSRPVVLIDAGIHAREWIAPAAALYVIQQLVENATESALTDAVDWHIVPVINPDGYEYTFGGDRLWRKSRSYASETCRGVDDNRNFDFHWMETGASSSPCAIDYAGPEPFSEAETSALRDHILANADRIKLYLTFHSYGAYFLYPWGYTSELPDDWEALDSLARQANAAQVAAGSPDYTIGSSTNVLFAAAGGSDDWAKGVGGVALSYTVELPYGGIDGFDPPASDIAGIVTPFFEAVRVFGRHVADNYGSSRSAVAH